MRVIFSFNYNKIMVSCLLSRTHQTHDMSNVYHVHFISRLYPTQYLIMSLFYHDYQTYTIMCLMRTS